MGIGTCCACWSWRWSNKDDSAVSSKLFTKKADCDEANDRNVSKALMILHLILEQGKHKEGCHLSLDCMSRILSGRPRAVPVHLVSAYCMNSNPFLNWGEKYHFFLCPISVRYTFEYITTIICLQVCLLHQTASSCEQTQTPFIINSLQCLAGQPLTQVISLPFNFHNCETTIRSFATSFYLYHLT